MKYSYASCCDKRMEDDTKKIRLRLLGTNNACRVCVPKLPQCKVKKKLTSDVLQDQGSC